MTHTHKKTGRVCRTKGEHRLPILPLPFICPSLYHPPSTIPSVRSVILSVPSVLLPLSGFGQSLADPDKRMLPVMEKEQRSWLSRGGGGRCRGGRVSGLDRHCQSCGYPLLFLGSLLIRHLPHLSLPSLISSSVHLFSGHLSFSGVRDGNVENEKCDRSLA